jgi:DNA-binding beta-propeller fold protein YncE
MKKGSKEIAEPELAKLLYKGTAGFIFMVFLIISAGAQNHGEYRVQWIAQYPSDAAVKRPDFGERLSRLVFGKKASELSKPFNVLAKDPGHFWILDQGSGGVLEVEGDEGQMIRPIKRAQEDFPSLVGICGSPDGIIYLTDSRLNQVLRLAGGKLSVFADKVALNQPTGLAYHPVNREIWVVETGAHHISVFDPEGKRIQTIGGRGATPGLFNYPTFIWIDAKGRVHVVDSMNFRIQVFSGNGELQQVFGEAGDATGNLARPKGIATDSKGHIYVADALFHAVQIFNEEGEFLYSFGRQGQGEGEFWMPSGIYIDQEDHIYVADSYNSRVQVFQLVKN